MDDSSTSSGCDSQLTQVLQSMAQMLQQALQQPTSSSASAPQSHLSNQPRPLAVAADRPALLATSSLSEFSSWTEAWKDYYQCQHLAAQDKATRVYAAALISDIILPNKLCDKAMFIYQVDPARAVSLALWNKRSHAGCNTQRYRRTADTVIEPPWLPHPGHRDHTSTLQLLEEYQEN